MLAHLFATEPDVLLLDEPTADLDPVATHAIMRPLRQTADAGCRVVVVLQAIELALGHATRMVVMQDGRIVAGASPAAAAFGMRLGIDPARRLLPPEGDVVRS
jgi:iron complex transport system ATP-binding protein